MFNKSIIFLLIFLLANCHQQKNQVNKIISTKDSQGILLDQSFYKNKWLIINYWASWCAPCLKEIPVINHFYNQFNKQGIRVVGIDLDPMDAGQMNKIKQTLHIDYPVVTLNILQPLSIEPDYLPVTIIINPQGYVVATVKGALRHSQLLKLTQIRDKTHAKHYT